MTKVALKKKSDMTIAEILKTCIKKVDENIKCAFDVKGLNINNACSLDFYQFKKTIEYMIKNDRWICPIKPTYGDDEYYSISKHEIVIPEKEQFSRVDYFYINIIHEMAHSTGVEQFLNRLKPTSFGSKEYAREELLAELTSAVILSTFNIRKLVKDDSAAYINSWLDMVDDDSNQEYLNKLLLEYKELQIK